jgi:hypothetical protein
MKLSGARGMLHCTILRYMAILDGWGTLAPGIAEAARSILCRLRKEEWSGPP